MAYKKSDFIKSAFNELRLADYVFDLEPQALENALRQLDMMMGTWNGRGIRVGYPIPSTPERSDTNEVTDCPDYSNEAIYLNLAIRIAPSFGKPVARELKVNAKEALNTLLIRSTQPAEMQLPDRLPKGAGNKPWRYDEDPFFRKPIDRPEDGQDSFSDYN